MCPLLFLVFNNDMHDSVKKSLFTCVSTTGSLTLIPLNVNDFFMNTCETLSNKLVILFIIIFSSGHFLQIWVDDVVITIHKKGITNTVVNYRGITLLRVLGKLFTRI